MRISKILIVGVISLFLTSNKCEAQISVGASVGSMLYSSEHSTQSFLFHGVNLEGNYNITKFLRVGLNAGYYSISDEIGNSKHRVFVIPVVGSVELEAKLGFFKPYLGLDLGIMSLGSSYLGEKDIEADFGTAGAFGMGFGINSHVTIDLNTKYNYFVKKELGMMSFNLGLVYTL